MLYRSHHNLRVSLVILVVPAILLSIVTGCALRAPGAKPDPKPNQPAAPAQPPTAQKAELAARISLPQGAAVAEFNTLAPDGNTAALMVTARGKSQDLVAADVATAKTRTLASIDARRLEAGTLLLRVFGWLSDSRLVFARQGTQPDGLHSGRRGLSVRIVDAKAPQASNQPEVREVNWLPVASGQYVHMIYEGVFQNSVFAGVGDTVWRIPLDGSAPVAVIKGLAGAFGPFYPRLSPDGTTFAYDRLGLEHAGIYVVPSTGGNETGVAPRGRTTSFYPQWSPDGRLFAVYTAGQKQSGTALMYDTIPLEDGPLAAAGMISIYNADGRPVTSITVPDHKLANMRWSRDSQSLIFAAIQEMPAGSTPAQTTAGAPVVWRSVYKASIGVEPVKLMDIPAVGAQDVNVLFSETREAGAHIVTRTKENKTLLHHAQAGRAPSQIMGPANNQAFLMMPLGMPSVGSNLFVVYDDGKHHHLVQVIGDKAMEIATGTDNSWVIGVSGRRVAFLREETREASNAILEVYQVR